MPHWQNLSPPSCPNEEETSLYKKLIGDSTPVCLLGMTKELVPFCDVAVDLNPHKIDKPIIKGNWADLTGSYGAIIGDGVLNLMGLEFVPQMLQLAPKLVCRVFMKKLPEMKYAQIFPTEFPGSKSVIITQPDIAIVSWEN
jgi:hypothetical protein